MDATFVAWIPAVCGGVAALLFYLRLRAESARKGEAVAEVEGLRKDLEVARAELAQRAANAQHRGSEVGELRRKLEKTKKRAARERDERSGDVDRIQELEGVLRGEKAALANMRVELNRVRAEAEAARGSGTPEPSVSPEPAAADGKRIEELERQLETAEKALEERDQKLAAAAKVAKKETSRLRGKLRTQDSVYMQLRGELEAKKDRLKTQREELERLRAYKVALVDAAPEHTPEAVVASQPEAVSEAAVTAETASQEAPAAEVAEAPVPSEETEDTPAQA